MDKSICKSVLKCPVSQADLENFSLDFKSRLTERWLYSFGNGTLEAATPGKGATYLCLQNLLKPDLIKEEELKSLLMKVKEESEKDGLKLKIQKAKIMASGSITSWQIDGGTVETVADFIFGGSKITANGDCSHEIKRCLLLGRKVMTNLDSILKKQRHYSVNKGPSSQDYGFSSGHVWL